MNKLLIILPNLIVETCSIIHRIGVGKSIFAILFLFSSCKPDIEKPQRYIGVSESELVDKLGMPLACGNINYYHGISLYEYQNSLYDILNDISIHDTVFVKECKWEKGNRTLVVWWKTNDTDSLSVDCLEWADNIEF